MRAAVRYLAERASAAELSAEARGVLESEPAALGGGSALTVLNGFAAEPPPVPVISPSCGKGWATPVTGAQFLSAVARDAIELFGGGRVQGGGV
ncbi:ABATE domain-containing protein [Streptosporangium album]|uniref:ABATE domain-containing protein n=1 Tax=Streptosporangium album TaxID=47479 RepID=UPI00161FC95C